jgi:hypothetical protein
MVGLPGITLSHGVNLHGLNCLGARHIALPTSIYLICAKVQIVANLPQIAILQMVSHFKWCHLANGILTLKVNVHVSYKYSMLVCTNLGGGYSTTWNL